MTAKTAKRVQMRTSLARFPFRRGLDSFDYRYQPSVDRKQVQKLSLCHGFKVRSPSAQLPLGIRTRRAGRCAAPVAGQSRRLVDRAPAGRRGRFSRCCKRLWTGRRQRGPEESPGLRRFAADAQKPVEERDRRWHRRHNPVRSSGSADEQSDPGPKPFTPDRRDATLLQRELHGRGSLTMESTAALPTRPAARATAATVSVPMTSRSASRAPAVADALPGIDHCVPLLPVRVALISTQARPTQTPARVSGRLPCVRRTPAPPAQLGGCPPPHLSIMLLDTSEEWCGIERSNSTARQPHLVVASREDVPESVGTWAEAGGDSSPCSCGRRGSATKKEEQPSIAKHDRRRPRRQPQEPQTAPTVTTQVPLPVLGVLTGIRDAFHGLCVATGLQVLTAMVEIDGEASCGPRGRHQAERTAWRGGSADSHLTLTVVRSPCCDCACAVLGRWRWRASNGRPPTRWTNTRRTSVRYCMCPDAATPADVDDDPDSGHRRQGRPASRPRTPRPPRHRPARGPDARPARATVSRCPAAHSRELSRLCGSVTPWPDESVRPQPAPSPARAASHPKDRSGAAEARSALTRRKQRLSHRFPTHTIPGRAKETGDSA